MRGPTRRACRVHELPVRRGLQASPHHLHLPCRGHRRPDQNKRRGRAARFSRRGRLRIPRLGAGMSMHAGSTLGAYHLMERIGRGGMASVYRAYHQALDRLVAVKVLPEFFAEDAIYRERFQHEAWSVARLRHPNILQVFDFGSEDGVPFIVMELVEGGTLADRLGAPMPLDAAISLLEPVAAALDYAHSRGVLHRDVKPTNILLREDGSPVLADFGLAKIAGLRRLTASGSVMGTPEYMSPEQAEDRGVSQASDLYSLAVVAHEMLTGRVPFEGDTPAAVLVSHVTRPLPAAHELRGELSAHVEDVLRRGLAKNPDDRYPSASSFAYALKPAAWPGNSGGVSPLGPAFELAGAARAPPGRVGAGGGAADPQRVPLRRLQG